MVSKDELRAGLQKRRHAFATQRASAVFEIPSELRVRLIAALRPYSSLAGYAALRGEPDIFELLGDVGTGKQTGLPFLDDAGAAMAFRSWSPGEPLQKSPFGFRQPVPDAPLLLPEAVFVPLIGFDRAFNRLGHGKGHYDRALTALPRAFKIGIGWSFQEVDTIAADPWDVPLDAVLTEREWIVRG